MLSLKKYLKSFLKDNDILANIDSWTESKKIKSFDFVDDAS